MTGLLQMPGADDSVAAVAQIDDDAIVNCVFALLGRRASDATICPSEVARALVAECAKQRDDQRADWRALMPRIREVAARLAAQGRLRVTRGGVEVDAASGGGPIRLGRGALSTDRPPAPA